MHWQLDLTAPVPAAPLVLDNDQRRVVAHREGPLLVLAGPGTGKTATICEAIVARLTDPVAPLAPDAILALTFGRRAAAELRARVMARLGGGAAPVVSTFHAFAFALERSVGDTEESLRPPRLLSGAEEDVRIRELLHGAVEDGVIAWPDDLAEALPTLGLANELRAVLARARARNLDADALARRARACGTPVAAAVAELARQVERDTDTQNAIDYGELLLRAVGHAHTLRDRFRAIYVDEYQDTDPTQVALLRALAGPGCSVVAVGDPDQAIYAFRGADVGGIERFVTDFPSAGGQPAPIAVLRTCRRFGPTIRAAASGVIRRNPLPAVWREAIARHRTPTSAASEGDDVVAVVAYDDEGCAAEHVADEIREAHVDRHVPWSRLAVLVRSSRSIAAVERALDRADIPCAVAADEIPLRTEPAVAALLGAMRVALGVGSDADIDDLLVGPLAGLTGIDLRRLGRALRAGVHEAGTASPSSASMVRATVREGIGEAWVDLPLGPHDPVSRAVHRLCGVLTQMRDAVADGATPADVLWIAWTGGAHPHGWPERLHAAAVGGSRAAGHDLDAVMALFETAERFVGRRSGVASVREFLASLAAQLIPAEPVADRGMEADAVRILTAHRAKGLEWDEVWVVGAQEGTWPDLRARSGTLRLDGLIDDGITDPVVDAAQALAEERRLFYVAATRARRRLHVAVVAAAADESGAPSRFVEDLLDGLGGVAGPGAPARRHGRPAHARSLPGLVAHLRTVAQDGAAPPALRQAAVERLAVLAAERLLDGTAVVPAAGPSRWWGVREETSGPRPVRDPDRPLALSGSMLDGLLACPLKWFLEREARAESPRPAATAFGSIVHALADHVAKGDVPADAAALDAELGRIWSAMGFEAGWQSDAERGEARAALARFVAYHLARERELVATEQSVGTTIRVERPDGVVDDAVIRGFIDRVERDDEGRLVAIDLKNNRRPPSGTDVREHGQLGMYQLILRWAGLAGPDEPADPQPVGGAALVQLRVPQGTSSDLPKEQLQPALDDTSPTWVEVRIGEAAEVIRREEFPAIRGRGCEYCTFRSACPAQREGGTVIA